MQYFNQPSRETPSFKELVVDVNLALESSYPNAEVIPSLPNKRNRAATRVAEDFRLTKGEKADLYLLVSKYEFGKIGSYRGAYWERICAVICLYLLTRDNRLSSYISQKAYYDQMYELYNNRNFEKFARRIFSELERIMNETSSFTWIK
jgi:hypothetical protein